jgi:hypothetical protein|tara:strand:+ start:967 stop:1746 length:780 start_codon:yes stop_codon:yes gene_type:complete
MRTTKKFYAATAFLTLLFLICLSGCSKKDSDSNPDFNQDVLFTDYGTYGRTIYFTDNEDQRWCYYDILSTNDSSQLTLVISEPILDECNIDTSIYLSILETTITGESKSKENLKISTIKPYFYNSVFPSNGDFSDANEEYQSKLAPPTLQIINSMSNSIFGSSLNSAIVDFTLKQDSASYIANIISPSDYFSLRDRSYPESVLELFSIFFLLVDLPPLDQPYPVVAAGDNRDALYSAHPYHKLIISDDNFYPIDQITID